MQLFSLSLISAISFDRVIANQVIEGNVNSALYENFLFRLVEGVRGDPAMKEKEVLIFMDNAKIHKTPAVL